MNFMKTLLTTSLLTLIPWVSYSSTVVQTQYQWIQSDGYPVSHSNPTSPIFLKRAPVLETIRTNVFESAQRIAYQLNDSLAHDGVKVGMIPLKHGEKDHLIYSADINQIPVGCNYHIVGQFSEQNKTTGFYLFQTCAGKSNMLNYVHYQSVQGSFGKYTNPTIQDEGVRTLDMTQHGLTTSQVLKLADMLKSALTQRIQKNYHDKYEANLD